jgi:phenylpropionate dioxygenase-like ring-hydroxylating dioxygenase large terminal subunit
VKHDEQVRLLKLLMHQLDTGTNLDAGVVLRNPASAYTSPELAEREREVFFRKNPQMIGMSGDLPEKGSFLTLDEWGAAILATRDKTGRFRAFLNACRHRGVQIESEARGQRSRFMCPFHAWTYSSEGELVSVPKADHFGEIDKRRHGLIELPAVEKCGVLLVHPEPGAEIDTGLALEGLGPDFDSWSFDQYAHVGSAVYDMPLNWKLAIDTFGETYHFSALHRNTLFPFFHGNVQGFDHWERNHRMILCVREIDRMRQRPEREWNIREGAFPVYYLFPNVIFNVGRHSFTVVRVVPHPQEIGRSASQVSFYYDAEQLDDAQAQGNQRELLHSFGAIIRDEDYAVASLSQRSADSGLQEWFLFGRNEPTLHHYHNTYRKVLGLPPLEPVESEESP